MKKLLSVISLCVLGLAATGCDSTVYKLALVTDSGTINDGSFNEAAWNGIKAYSEENEIAHKYYQPAAENDDERWTSIQLAVKGGAEVVVLPGYLFNTVICDASLTFPDTKFLLIDGDYKSDNQFGETYDSSKTYDNVYCVSYQEEQAGFLAGYAAVKDGYTDIGFFGGMSVPAVVKFGHGYVQGADIAAKELSKNIKVTYNYAGQFYSDGDTDTKMKTWQAAGVQAIFACGGGIWNSVGAAATNTNLKMIGVDVDQADCGDFVLTSAVKGIKETVISTLETFYAGNWNTIGGDIDTLGLGTSSTSTQYVGLPTSADSWRFDTFTVTDYNTLVSRMQNATTGSDYKPSNITTPITTTAGFTSGLGLTNTTVTYHA